MSNVGTVTEYNSCSENKTKLLNNSCTPKICNAFVDGNLKCKSELFKINLLNVQGLTQAKMTEIELSRLMVCAATHCVLLLSSMTRPYIASIISQIGFLYIIQGIWPYNI